MLAKGLQGLLTDRDRAADDGEARNFAIHLSALTSSKVADGLVNPKLVLAWLLSALGAPGYLIGALVPVREAGALLPQLALAGWIQSRTQRKTVWALGAMLQGFAAFGIALFAVVLDGAAAGWAILGCVALLAVARSLCSASHKDVLARTVGSGARGTVSGSAGTAAASVVLGFAVLLGTGLIPRETAWIAGTVSLAGLLWLVASASFLRLSEPVPDNAPATRDGWAAIFAPLVEDAELRRYLAVRILLIPTALAPPFLIMLSATVEGSGFGNLGLLILGSSAATILSSYVWGRISDRSSRQTLALAGLAAALFLGIASAAGLATGGLGGAWGAAAFVFAAQIAYEGTRAGRKTHLTDMDTGGRKTIYTALSNTIVGVMLLAGGGFGLLADTAGPSAVLAAFAGMAGAGAVLALGLREVQTE